MVWWFLLGAVGIANIGIWISEVVRRRYGGDTSAEPLRRSQLVLSAVFVLGCAYRAVLPRAEAQRFVLVDSWISSAMLGRAVATVAELALVAQFSLLLYEYSSVSRYRTGVWVSRLLVPIIASAEICSWYSALTANFLGSVFEESQWTLTAILLVTSFIALWKRERERDRQEMGGQGRDAREGREGREGDERKYARHLQRSSWRRFTVIAIWLGIGYIGFMCLRDVPMYATRWRDDQQHGRVYHSVGEGWRDSVDRRIVTRRMEDWAAEMPWMSLYFSIGVWISIALVRAPRLPAPDETAI